MYYWRGQWGYFLGLILTLSVYYTVEIICSYKGIFVDRNIELFFMLTVTFLLIRLIFPKMK